jgi:hypothetical protein
VKRKNDREEFMNPLICIQGSASPGRSYPMTPLHVKNSGHSPAKVSYAVNPAGAKTWLRVSSMEIPAGKSVNVPVTLVVPSQAVPGEAYVILTAGGTHFDVRFSVSVPAPRECVAAGYKPGTANHSSAALWLVLLIVIVGAFFWVRRRRARG